MDALLAHPTTLALPTSFPFDRCLLDPICRTLPRRPTTTRNPFRDAEVRRRARTLGLRADLDDALRDSTRGGFFEIGCCGVERVLRVVIPWMGDRRNGGRRGTHASYRRFA